MFKNSPLKKLAEFLIIGVVSFFVIKILVDSWSSIAPNLTTPNLSDIFVAWLFALGYFFLRALAWKVIINDLGYKLEIKSASRIWLISEFSRFIPGNIWSFLARIYMSEDKKIPKKITLTSLILEVVMLVGSALIFGLLFFLLTPYQSHFVSPWLFLLSVPIIGLLLSPNLLKNSINFLLRKAKKTPIDFKISPVKLLLSTFIFSLAWLAYALGSYFVASAFVNLSTLPFIWVLSTFIMAWLVGYISFITPMGLGVREGILILALKPIMSSGLASLIAVMTRIWLTLSEISVLLLIFLFNEFRKPKVKKWFKEYRYEVILAIAILAYIVYFSTITFLKQANFITAHYDLGIMDQVVWNTAHGHFFQMTQPDGIKTVSRFFTHADIFLVLLAPLYWIYSSPYILLFVQVLVVALGAIPLYLLGKNVIKSRVLALVIAISYLLFSPLQWAVLFDFHAVTLACPFILFAFYYLHSKKYWPFVIFGLLALSTKETIALLGITIGLYILASQKNWKLGSLVILLSGTWFYLLLFHIMPGDRPHNTAHFAIGYYSQYGHTPKEVVKTILTKPTVWLPDILNLTGLKYLLMFVLPTGLLALLSPIILLALPSFLINLLSNNPLMHTIYFQYTAAITPFIFISFVFGLNRFKDIVLGWNNKRKILKATDVKLLISAYILVFVAGSMCLFSPLPGFPKSNLSDFNHKLAGAPYLNNLARTIPVTARVSATNKLSPHFSEREHIYPFPQGLDQADYVLVETDQLQDLALGDTATPADVQIIKQDTRFKLIYQKEDLLVYKRK